MAERDIQRVARAVKKARGRIPPRAAARQWGVAYSTLRDVETCLNPRASDYARQISRNWSSTTLAQFNEMLRTDTWALYEGRDLTRLEQIIEAAQRMSDEELDDVLRYLWLVFARRQPT
jgi:hypothetical protein